MVVLWRQQPALSGNGDIQPLQETSKLHRGAKQAIRYKCANTRVFGWYSSKESLAAYKVRMIVHLMPITFLYAG